MHSQFKFKHFLQATTNIPFYDVSYLKIHLRFFSQWEREEGIQTKNKQKLEEKKIDNNIFFI